jgi:hypothetical protein
MPLTRRSQRLSRIERDIDEIRHVATFSGQGFHNLHHELTQMRNGLATLANVGDSVVALGRRLARERDADSAERDEIRRAVAELVGIVHQLAAHIGFDLPPSNGGAPSTTTKPRDAMLAVTRVHIGEARPDDDVVCLDDRDADGVDHVVRLHRLPIAAGSLELLSVGHVLERYSERRLRDELLPAWRELLAPGGQLRVVALDGAATLGAWHDGQLSFDDVRSALASPNDGEPLRSTFDAERLMSLLRATGFADVSVVATGRLIGQRIEMELRARRDDAS